ALDGEGMPWRVSGVTRAAAGIVPADAGRPIYGGTPADQAVIEAIRAMNDAGQAVMFYPFILMEQVAGNGLMDPWSGAPDQPVLPWRGRITTSLAPGQPGSPDGSAAADAEVGSFFGSATAGDFMVSGDQVTFTGSDVASYRRFILHYAHLCAVAGGVEAFCIGSEMRGLTQVRGAADSFPAVEQLRALAGEVRSILGPSVKIGYAADWSEYFGYHPQDGSGDVYFHLDPLWADAEIDFIGIDNYMPVTDWRDGPDHADASWGSIHDLSYLKANIAGGEGFDWYYRTAEAEALQIRTPITDGAFAEPWVFRYKDLKNWWQEPHHNRTGGARDEAPTAWQPGSKPIWFTEIGCAAIDKGTNQPNKFLDPKSSESALPKYSNGGRDDLIQTQYLRAVRQFWEDPSNNPVSDVYDAEMVDPGRMFVWAWDARPYPFFPGDGSVWSDGENYARGHWLNGRSTSRTLAGVVSDICGSAGVTDVETDRLFGIVRGFTPAPGAGARASLQNLLLTYGADAIERDGKLVFRNRSVRSPQIVTLDDLASGEGASAIACTRAPEAEISGRVRLGFVEADADYEVRSVDAIFPDEASVGLAESEVPLTLTSGEARGVVDRWLSEARVARDMAAFALPPSSDLSAGDTVRIDVGDVQGTYRIDRVADGGLKQIEAVRVEAGIYDVAIPEDGSPGVGPVAAPLPVWAEVLDLPAAPGRSASEAPWVAASSRPWPGDVAVYSSRDGASWRLDDVVSSRAVMGQTLNDLAASAPGVWDRGAALNVRFLSGALSSVDEATLFAGGNSAVILAPGTGPEVFQFRDADLIAPDTWALSKRLRGQQGTDALIAPTWPTGSTVILLDAALTELPLAAGLLEAPRRYRIGPADKPVDHAAFVEVTHQATGLALMPYRPAHLTARREADGSLSLTWIRRTRIDGDSWLLADVPLGETEERYLVQVSSAGALRREISVTAPLWTYSAADQAADGVGTAFTIEVAQISDRVGPGHKARIDING
ncbi:MAG: glycoside hydrolase/phage tail family protein, partial [Silicimonas sp.]|nr:glycoside hydrolase/phage tail family protein [Silicimonas sp.]